MKKEFTQLQLDGIKEICHIASCNAATALSRMMNKKISMKVPDISIVPIEQATASMGNPDSIITGLYCQIIGDFSGVLLLTFPREESLLLIEKLLGKQQKIHTLSEIETSAMIEVGNIISSAFVSAIAKMLDKLLLINIPKLAIDMLGSIVDFVLIELAENAEDAVIVKIEFEDIPKTISGHFFIIPNPDSLKLLLESIKQ